MLADLEAEARSCRRCRLAEGRTNVVWGTGDTTAGLMFVGEGPGADEDRQGFPFVGRSGQLLDRLIAEELGMHRGDCYICNVVKCRPPGNRDPEPDEIEACRPYLEAQVDHIAPRVVVTLGAFAARTLLRTEQAVTGLRGRVHPFRGGSLVATYHPAYALRGGGEVLAAMRADLVRAKRELGARREDGG